MADALFTCTGRSAMVAVLEGGVSFYSHHNNDNRDKNYTNKHNNTLDNQEVMLELAAYVAAGGILPAPGGVTATTNIMSF